MYILNVFYHTTCAAHTYTSYEFYVNKSWIVVQEELLNYIERSCIALQQNNLPWLPAIALSGMRDRGIHPILQENQAITKIHVNVCLE